MFTDYLFLEKILLLKTSLIAPSVSDAIVFPTRKEPPSYIDIFKMEKYKTYTIKARKTRSIWIFKYHLDGTLHSFNVLDGAFNRKAADWLFVGGRFPYTEEVMIKFQRSFKAYFDVEVGIPDITFDYFYELYGKKTTKKQSSDYWRKMKESDRIKAVLSVKRYSNNCKFANRTLVDPVRYLKHRRYDDEQ